MRLFDWRKNKMTFTKCSIAMSLALLLGTTSAQAANVSLQNQSGPGPGVVTWDVVYTPAPASAVASLQQNIGVVPASDPNDVSGTDSGNPGFLIPGFQDVGDEILYGGLDPNDIATPSPVVLGTFSVDWDGVATIHIVSKVSEFKDGTGARLSNTTGHILAVLGSPGEQIKDKQKCINKMNKEAAKLLKAYSGDAGGCIKNYGKGKSDKLGPGETAHSCLTADVKSKVSKASSKVTSAGGCTAGADFAFEDPAVVLSSAEFITLGLLKDIFHVGPPSPFTLDLGLADSDDPKDDAKCQSTAHKNVAKLLDTKMKVFAGCKKEVLKAKTGSPPPDLGALANGVVDCIETDAKSKISKAVTKLSKITDKCTLAQVPELFKGKCKDAASPAAFLSCLDRLVECRFCQAIESFDGMPLNCDQFDDGEQNGTCTSLCGDNIVGPNEVCDDGNDRNWDGCQQDCTAFCGDGIVRPPVEQCDPPTPGLCGDQCEDIYCGNLTQGPGEECDDGCLAGIPFFCEPVDDGDGCSSTCTLEP
jgi:cysteine-rich repeat protein